MKKRLKKGFTLVELVVVIAIIAILSAVSVAGYFGFTTNARKTATKQEAKDIANLILVVAADEETTGVTNGATDKEIKTLKYEHNNFAYTITVGTGDVAFVA